MIIPISFQFSEDFTKAREVMSKYLPTRWLSTYSRNPASLFDAAVGVRSTILVSRKSQVLLAVTGLRRWYSEFRPHLFETTSYSRVEGIKVDEPWPRLASKEIVEFHKALILKKMRLKQAHRRSTNIVGFKNIALYYISSFLEEPPTWSLDGETLSHTEISELTFDTEEDKLIAFGITAGRIAGWW